LALKRYDEAKSAIKVGLQLKADDKEMLQLLAKIDEELRKNSSATKKSGNVSAPPTSARDSRNKHKVKQQDVDDMQVDDESEEALNLRGYKRLSDGRITTFFNNELDEKVLNESHHPIMAY
jgi:hypothetical protein